jgi:glutamate racemase
MQIICVIYLFFITLQRKSTRLSTFDIPPSTQMIGIFDSGYGGLTIFNHIRQRLPQYDYLYLGDNARAPYGTRSFDVIYEYTLQAVNYLHQQGCNLIILACNTASAKALRTIQQNDINPDEVRVLGVIRPTVEVVPTRTRTNHIGVLATPGTVASESYVIELQKQKADLVITQQACPMWVPLIESGEHLHEGADYFVEKYLTELLERDPQIDTIILGCTHYPLLQEKIEAFLAKQTISQQSISVIAQGEIVAESLADYLERHADIAKRAILGSTGSCTFLTTEAANKFSDSASLFLDKKIEAKKIEL